MAEQIIQELIKSHMKLLEIQQELKVPKNQFNEFGNYKYRSCEDILEAVKLVLKEKKAMILFRENIILLGNRYYIEATAIFIDLENMQKIEATAHAREDETQSKKDGSQVTGSSSSYAKKYALNSLLCIDDTKDSDHDNKHGKDKNIKGQTQTPNNTEKKFDRKKSIDALKKIKNGNNEIEKDFLIKSLEKLEKEDFFHCKNFELELMGNEIKKMREKVKQNKETNEISKEIKNMITYIDSHKTKHYELIQNTLNLAEEPFIDMLDEKHLKELYNLIKGVENDKTT